MAVPDFQSMMLPLLRLAADGREHTLSEAIDALAQQFGLTEADRKEMLPPYVLDYPWTDDHPETWCMPGGRRGTSGAFTTKARQTHPN